MIWTLESLERALRKALTTQATLRVKALTGRNSAEVEWESGGKAKVKVDTDDVGLRPGVIHELLHVVLDKDLEVFDSEIEEKIILALEKALDVNISKSKRRIAWWRKNLKLMSRK